MCWDEVFSRVTSPLGKLSFSFCKMASKVLMVFSLLLGWGI
jgi:hypothetical protein